MKSLKRVAGAIVLTLSLSICAWAGQMDTPPEPPPPPGETQGFVPTNTPPETVNEASLTEFAVGILGSILPLL